jgi:hypothetical protein
MPAPEPDALFHLKRDATLSQLGGLNRGRQHRRANWRSERPFP